MFGGAARTAATSKMGRFVIIIDGWKPLTIITQCSILDVAVVLDLPLTTDTLFCEMVVSSQRRTNSINIH